MAGQTLSARSLTQEEIKRVQDWSKTKGTGGAGCPFCGTNHWATHGELVEFRHYSGGRGLITGGIVIPAVMLICHKCGHLEFISALAAGIVKIDELKTGKAAEQPEAKEDANG